MTSTRFFGALLTVVLAFASASAQTFDRQTYPAVHTRQIVADLNRDGFPDLVLWGNKIGTDPGGIAVLLNRGNGTFSSPIDISDTDVFSLRAGDINGDHKIDLVRCNAQGLAVWLGDGTGHFSKVSQLAVPCNAFAVADFDQDGFDDVAVVQVVNGSFGPVSNTATVYRGTTSGAFASNTLVTTNLGLPCPFDNTTGSRFTIPVAGDLNRDGYPDLAVAEQCGNGQGGYIATLTNEKNAHFAYHRLSNFQASINVDELFINDMNQDGWLDLIANVQEDYVRPLAILLRQSDGSYARHDIYTVPLESGNSSAYRGIAFGDFDGDGVKDIVLDESHFSESDTGSFNTIHVLYPSSNDFTQLKNTYDIPYPAGSNDIDAADFDLDGRPDFTVLNGASQEEVFLNRTASAPVCSTATSPLRTVRLCAPAEGATVSSPTHVVANLISGTPLSATKIYIDGVSDFIGYDNLVNTFLNLANGTHKITVKGWDDAGSFSTSHTFTVSGASSCSAPTTNRTVKICSPLNGATTSTSVHLQAAIADTSSVSVKVYVDGISKFQTTSKSIDWTTTLTAGSHKITVKAWDSSGNFFTSVNFTVN